MAHAQFGHADGAAAYVVDYTTPGPSSWFFAERISIVMDALGSVDSGRILDVGSGPAMLLRRIADERPGQFRMTALDLSVAMVVQAEEKLADVDGFEAIAGSAEAIPFAASTFDVVIALGVLEYCDRRQALREIQRVVRPGGVVIVSMLNPASPYRLFEWCVKRPLGRSLRRLRGPRGGRVLSETTLPTGVWAVPAFLLRQELRRVGLRPERLKYFDTALLVPPFDRKLTSLGRPWGRVRSSGHPRLARFFGTAYVWAARRAPA